LPLRRILPVIAAFSLVAPPGPAVASPESGLRKSLSRAMRDAGGDSGAFVRDVASNKRLFAWNHTGRLILASNTKLFTVGAALEKHGPGGRIRTRVVAGRRIEDANGTIAGSLFLVGGGDPTFGGKRFVRDEYGGGGTVERLADQLKAKGLRRVKGGVVGDESLFDSRRGGPTGGYSADPEVGGPLTALVFNRGLTKDGSFQGDPPSYAADRLADALERRGIDVERSARSGRAPDDYVQVARVHSLPMSRIAELTAEPSDNYFGEILAKGVGSGGTTRSGTRAMIRYAKRRGADGARFSDGSGLSRSNQLPPQEVVHFLDAVQDAPERDALYEALPIAGVSGTLEDRMESGRAHANCRAKTGTLVDVSTLSGYCQSRRGRLLAFSFLMNHVSISHARSLQDRMAQSLANYDG
jgi:D-alanyl-D-alanine carboxypeptidase/D-alanyl-D-alanine-endopeptidase (penicillin-binding protein 4)